jgi:hypothetical protein
MLYVFLKVMFEWKCTRLCYPEQFKDAKGDCILYALVMHNQSEPTHHGWYVNKKHLSIGWQFMS